MPQPTHKSVTGRVPKKLHQEIVTLARRNRASVPDTVRRLLEMGLTAAARSSLSEPVLTDSLPALPAATVPANDRPGAPPDALTHAYIVKFEEAFRKIERGGDAHPAPLPDDRFLGRLDEFENALFRKLDDMADEIEQGDQKRVEKTKAFLEDRFRDLSASVDDADSSFLGLARPRHVSRVEFEAFRAETDRRLEADFSPRGKELPPPRTTFRLMFTVMEIVIFLVALYGGAFTAFHILQSAPSDPSPVHAPISDRHRTDTLLDEFMKDPKPARTPRKSR